MATSTRDNFGARQNGRLPRGWRVVKFGDVVRDVNESERNPLEAGLDRYVALEHLDPNNLTLQRWGDLTQDPVSFTKRFRSGQVLFAKRRAYQRKVAVAQFDGICSSDILALESGSQELLNELVPFIVQSDAFFDHALGTSSGSLSPRTRWSQLKTFEFPLPPIDEQTTIAQILRASDACRKTIEQVVSDISELRKATILDVYQSGIGHTDFIESEIGRVPRSWEVAALETHYEVQLGKMMSPKAREGGSQRPYMRNANVQWNTLDLDDVATMSFNEKEVVKFELKYGDILACEGRHVGKSAMWRDEIPGACYQKALHRIRARDDEQVPQFLLYQMEFCHWKGRFADYTRETTIPHLPAERLRRIPFIFPPKAEQERVVAVIEALDLALGRTREHLDATRRLCKRLVEHLLHLNEHSDV